MLRMSLRHGASSTAGWRSGSSGDGSVSRDSSSTRSTFAACNADSPMRDASAASAAATMDLSAPDVEWRGQDTFIQKEGIVDDFGTFDDPDAFSARHGTNLRGPKLNPVATTL